MGLLIKISKYGIALYAISALLPLLKFDAWWIRVFDFPRLQLLCLGLVFGGIYLFVSRHEGAKKYIVLVIWAGAAGLDVYRVLPYSRLWPQESRFATAVNEGRRLRIITVNVFQDNTEFTKLLEIVKEHDPHLLLLLEVNERWLRDLSSLGLSYPYSLKRPLENTYGIALYSRLPLKNAEIKYLIEPDIPSVKADVVLPAGDSIQIYGLHPRPPGLHGAPTTERDAELIQVAKTIRQSSRPSIVMGDLNDVAWSHTSRLFRRISGLLDPRVGRKPFPTFPVGIPFGRFPLDYVFHSSEFTIRAVERLGDIGSDHFPMYIELVMQPAKEHLQEGPELEEGDLTEAEETIKRAKESEKK